jgi:hypothetical protein
MVASRRAPNARAARLTLVTLSPPGVTVQEPAPFDQEAETVLENLEEHLSHI